MLLYLKNTFKKNYIHCEWEENQLIWIALNSNEKILHEFESSDIYWAIDETKLKAALVILRLIEKNDTETLFLYIFF